MDTSMFLNMGEKSLYGLYQRAQDKIEYIKDQVYDVVEM
jgi:hypothetical protein